MANLADNNAKNSAAIAEAGAIGPLVGLLRSETAPNHAKGEATRALYTLNDFATTPPARIRELEAEVAALKLRVPEQEDAVDLTREDDDDEAHRDKRAKTTSGLKVLSQTTELLVKVKEEKAEAIEAKDDAQETLGFQVRTTNSLHSKIDELATLATASGADPHAVRAIVDRRNY